MEKGPVETAKERLAQDLDSETLQAVLNTTIDAIFAVDGEGRILSYNHGATRLFGQTEPLSKYSLKDIIADSPIPLSGTVRPLSSNPKGVSANARSLDGKVFPIHVVIGEPYGRDPVRFPVVIHDRSVRARVQAELSKASEVLERTVSGTSDGIWYVEFDEQERYYYSPHLLEILGLENFEGKIHALLDEASEGRMTQALEEHIALGTPFEVEFPFTVGGVTRWFMSQGRVHRDESGQPRHMAGSIADITDTRQAQQDLRETQSQLVLTVQELRKVQERLELAISGTSDGIWDWNLSDGTIYESPTMQEMLEIAPGSGRHLGDVISTVEDSRIRTAYLAHLQSGQLFDLEFPCELPSGQRKWFRIRGRAAKGSAGKPVRMAGSISDVTDRHMAMEALEEMTESLTHRIHERTADLRRANAELERASRSKDAFLASMSHELRTPLNAVLGLTEALGEEIYGPINAEQRRALDTIESSGKHLLALISDVLDLAKIHAGRMRLEAEPVSLRDLIQSSIAYVRRHAEKAGLSLVVSDVDPSMTMVTDGRRLRQILINLLSNAVKFTPTGRVMLEINPMLTEGIMEFRVSDTGIGIPLDRQREIFEPFRQIDSKLSREYEGTGLGLALVRELVDAFGGSLSLQSELGVGSTFEVRIPWQRLERSESEPKAPIHFPERVLVVEDNVSDTERISRILDELGIAHHAVCHAEEIAEAVKTFQPHALILDVVLPGETGWEFLGHAADICGSIPIIVCSVLDDPSISLAAGATAHITKPFTRRDMIGALRCIQGEPLQIPKPVRNQRLLKVLLAEDNSANQRAMGDFLRSYGHEVQIANNGLEAVNAAQTNPDVIVMDIQMPVMDGLEAIRRIRAIETGQTVPIIAVTALAMPGDRDRCLTAGATDYLSKPVSLQELRRRVEALAQESY